jgi:hypothetical protein
MVVGGGPYVHRPVPVGLLHDDLEHHQDPTTGQQGEGSAKALSPTPRFAIYGWLTQWQAGSRSLMRRTILRAYGAELDPDEALCKFPIRYAGGDG